jgi:hypothetical protein
MRTFSVKNFDKFQHYKDRSPPWIKLYNELLDDYEFGRLQDASKMHLIAIWLLASRSDNVLPYDSEWIARRINATSKVNLDQLVEAGFIVPNQPLHNAEQDASKPLAKCLPRDRGETEGETEKNIVHFEEFWSSYPRRQARRNAEAAYRSALKRASHGEILQGLKGYAFSPDPKFIPLAATWLNGDRWRDERPPDRPSDGGFQLRPLGVGG